MKNIFLVSFIFLFTISTQAQWWGNNERIKGNGNVVKENRKTDDYESVSLGGSFNVELVKGKEGNLVIEGEKNLLPYIITEVKNGNLKIKVKKGYSLKTSRKLLVTVPIDEIEKVALGGSGNIYSKTTIKSKNLDVSLGGSGNIEFDLDAEKVKCSIGGSGNIELSGNANYMSCSIAGSGSVKSYDLNVESLKASIAGSGSIQSSVKNEIKATIAGSGSIYYKGDPDKIDTKSVGSGNVVKKG